MRNAALRSLAFAILALAAPVFSGGTAFAAASSSDASDLEWQKASYENRLTQELRSAISETVPEKQFIVNVSIQLKPRHRKPSLRDAYSAGSTDPAELVPLGKLNLDAPMPQPDNEHSGLLESIAKLTVTVLLDSAVPDAKQEVVNRIIQNLTDPVVGEGRAEISFDKVDLVTPHPAERWGFLRWLLELRMLLAAVFAALCLSFVGYLGVREYRRLELRKLSILEQQYGRPAAPIEISSGEGRRSSGGGSAAPGSPAFQPFPTAAAALPGMAPMSGFQKFRTIVREDREKAITLLKQWIKAGNRQSQAALAALPHLLDNGELVGLLPYLKVDEKRTWKRIVDKGLPAEAIAEADGFMSAQVLGALLECHPEFDDELVRKVAELSLAGCLEIANEEASLGAVLAMILPAAQLSSFYDGLRPEVVNEIIETIMTMTDERAKDYSTRLRTTIDRVASESRAPAPFADRMEDLLRNARPENESAIFDLLSRSGNPALLEETARQFFPAELVSKLPPALLKACLSRFALDKQVEIIFSREKERPALLDSLGLAGSKSRELIDVEVESLARDEVRARRVKRQSAELWRGFVGTVRELLKGSDEARELAGEVLKPWIASRTGGAHERSAG